MSIRFIHTADIHFGVENYGHVDPATGLHSRLIDFRNSFQYIVDYAIKEDVDLFVFAGDAYKNSCPSPTHQRILLKLFFQLLDKGIPVVIVVGNHDHPGGVYKAHALDVFYHIKNPLCTIFGKMGSSVIQTKSGPLQVIGVPWPFPILFGNGRRIHSDEIKERVIEKLNEYKKKLNPSIPAILVGHLTMKNGVFSGSERIMVEERDPLFTIEELSDDAIKYIALGHLHKFQCLTREGDNVHPIVYSGSPDRIDFGEKDDFKTFCDVSVGIHKNTEYKRVPVPCRPFYVINVHIDSLDSVKKIIVQKLLEYENIKEAIVKIRYTYDDAHIKYIDIAFFKEIIHHVWHVASIECMNNYRKKNVSSMKHNLTFQDKSLYELVDIYIDSHEVYKTNKKLYLSTLKEYLE